MTQMSATLASLIEHYTDAVTRNDVNRAMDVAATYLRLTGRLISEDISK